MNDTAGFSWDFCTCSEFSCIFVQLHERFERVKHMHQEEKKTLEEKRRELEEEINSFNRKKMAAETMQALSLQTSKDKKR